MSLLRVPAGAAALAVAAVLAGCSQAPVPRAATPVPATTVATTPALVASPSATPRAARPSPVAKAETPSTPAANHHSSPPRAPAPSTAAPTVGQRVAAPDSSRLPVAGATADAEQLITVAAPALGSTRATVQAWQRVGAGWQRVGGSTPAWLGAAGLSTTAREGYTGTPVGSFTLTQSFGNNSNPGTRLPYFEAGPDDWWSGDSSSGTYNTHQRCASGSCPFDTAQSENLHDAGWVYGYAVVIDYNTAPARPGKGSAFFLHVTQNEPTEGCVSIDRDDLVRMLRWLDPARHPRILMGVG